jgi:hypothetical protein
MSQIQFTITNKDDCVDDILALIKEVYNKKDVDLEVESDIVNLIEPLKDEIFFCIEFPYVDRFYRDTYYTYFSSKHNGYYRDCIRVSLFEMSIETKHFLERCYREELINTFRGYFIIRPTFPNVVGRTLINKNAFLENDFLICEYSTNVSVNGIKLPISGFPFSSQDDEAITCAETSIWALMEYFGNRYADYKPTAPFKIIDILNKQSSERLIPSAGLNVNQISFTLKEFGFATQIYERDTFGDDFQNIISTYIESGLPLVCILKSEDSTVAHANLLIGHENDENIDFTNVLKREITFSRRYPQKPINKKFIDYGDIDKMFIVNDDNLIPYVKVSLDNPTEHLGEGFEDYQIYYIIVPLHKRIYSDVINAKNLILNILTDDGLGHVFFNDFVFRFFLTSSRSFKEHIANIDTLEPEAKKSLIFSKMPKFIWCAEIYQKNDFSSRVAKGLIIIDATEGKQWVDALIFAGYPGRIIVRIGSELVNLQKGLKGYLKYSNNLR